MRKKSRISSPAKKFHKENFTTDCLHLESSCHHEIVKKSKFITSTNWRQRYTIILKSGELCNKFLFRLLRNLKKRLGLAWAVLAGDSKWSDNSWNQISPEMMTEDCKTASTMVSANFEGATTCPGYNRQPQSETRGEDEICESCCYTRTSSKAFPHMSKKSASSWRKNSMHSTFSSLVAFILLALLLTCNISIADDATGTTTSAPPSRYDHWHVSRIF